MNSILKNIVGESLQKAAAALLLAAIFAAPLTASAQQQTTKPSAKTLAAAAAKSLTEEQRILHVLNRLGYGARPGDIERVRAVGVEKYIEQQLNADKLNDKVAEQKLQSLDVLKLSNQELFARYPNQAAVVQLVAQRNGVNLKELRGDLKEQRLNSKSAQNDQMTAMEKGDAPPVQNDAQMNGGETAKNPQNSNAANANDANFSNQNSANFTDAERREYQRQIQEIYRENNLGRPNEITQQLISSRILRAVYSERQLQEQMVDFWTNHFNVYTGKASTRWFLPEYDRAAIRPNALGNFKDLLAATAKSPAMLFYLDNYQSVAPNNNQNNRQAERLQRLMQNGGQIPERAKNRIRERFPNLSDEQIEQRLKNQMQNAGKNRRGINENYARELMELHTLGVDGGYSQKDIQEVARCFTGWTIVDARGYKDLAAKMAGGGDANAMRPARRMQNAAADQESGTFYFNERQHDAGEKTVLGQKIAAGGGIEDGLKVIDILVKQPATAKFIARKLAVKFVSDNPSDALVSRVADAFSQSNGDIKTTLRAIFSSPEFFAHENYRAKIKTPFEVVASSIRVLGADTNAGPQMQGLLAKMGEPLYGYIAPTGYPDTARDWVNTGALLERLNFGLALTANRIPGTKIDLTKFTKRDPDNKEEVMNAFLTLILDGEVSPATRTTLEKQLNQPLPEIKPNVAAANTANAMENVSMPKMNGGQGGRKNGGINAANRLLPASGNAETVKIVGLILGSPEFQRQ